MNHKLQAEKYARAAKLGEFLIKTIIERRQSGNHPEYTYRPYTGAHMAI